MAPGPRWSLEPYRAARIRPLSDPGSPVRSPGGSPTFKPEVRPLMEVTRTPAGLTVDLASEADTLRLGRVIAELVEPGVVIGLVGPLGAGKTRLVRAIAEALGVDPAAISSPTFV